MLENAFLDAARDLIRADSVTDRGNLKAVAVLKPLWEAAGLSARLLPSARTSDRDANLLAGPFGQGEADPLLLVTHLDTVDPGPRDRWLSDPFALRVQGDRAIGLGVADVKLDALCKLWAARRLCGVALKRPFYFLGTFGEEAGLRGAREFASALPFRPFAALCGEPSELVLCHAHKGYAVVRVTVRSRIGSPPILGPAALCGWDGRAAHSSAPKLGVNAIDLALAALTASGAPAVLAIDGGVSANTIPARCEAVIRAPPDAALPWKAVAAPPPDEEHRADVSSLLPHVVRLRDLWRERVARLSPAEDLRFDPPTAVANLTRIRTGRDSVELTLDGRLLPAHDAQSLVASFTAEAESLGTASVEVRVQADRCADGMALPETHPFLRDCGEALESVGLPGTPRAKPTSTEAGVFWRAGCPALVFGPSPSAGNAHCANEYALLGQLERAIDAYEAMLRRLCVGG